MTIEIPKEKWTGKVREVKVGATQADDQLFHILYDGTLVDEKGTSVLGGDADTIAGRLTSTWSAGDDLATALPKAVAALAGPERSLSADDLEVAVLSRSNGRRCFQRLDDALVASIVRVTDVPPQSSPGQ